MNPKGVRLLLGITLLLSACATLPETKHKKYTFPESEAFFGEPPADRPYEKLGLVRSKVEYPTLDPNNEEDVLCRNYFNHAVEDLVKFAKAKGGDAVIDVKSVVFLLDGQMEAYPRAECVDEGDGGQVLARGIAIKWKKPEKTAN
jgi:hypothetical protein